MSLEFAWPWLFAALPLPLLAILLPRAAERSLATLRVPFFTAVNTPSLLPTKQRSNLRLLLAIAAWLLLLTAAARPQLIGEPLHLPISGRDLMLAIDLSGSMESDDMMLNNRRMNRLHAVKEVAGEFIERRTGDRLGLILFGDQAYLQAPLTFDRKTVRQLLNESAIGLAGKKTAIGDAIGLAVKRLREQSQENRVLILLTDGSNTAGTVDPMKAADLAAQEGIRIHTIGIGADEQLMRGFFGSRRVMNTDLDEEALKAIAQKTNGRYFRGRDLASLEEIYQLLDELEPVAEEQQLYRPVDELYRWPLAVALLLSILIALTNRGLLPGVRHV
ncbi:MAG: VWA domain-containing protein [Candidatus Polarisedimenticolaceae bacterium]|nr:VWA domain-containing protein [Candidatus Polarisedimenticolaceae bacterium]